MTTQKPAQKTSRYVQLNELGIEKLNQLWEAKHPGMPVSRLAKLIGSQRNSGKEFTNQTLKRIKLGRRVEPASLAVVERYFKYNFSCDELVSQGAIGQEARQGDKQNSNTEPQESAPSVDDSPDTSPETQSDSEPSPGPIRSLLRLGALFSASQPSTNRDRLLRRISDDIDQRIEGILNERVRDRFLKITPEKEDNPRAVGREKRELVEPDNRKQSEISYTRVLSTLEKSSEKVTELESSQRILPLFKGRGIPLRLLILGAPGSGKTTELLELAYDLLIEAKEQKSAPIPLIFELSSWNKGKSIKDWLIEQSKRIYSVPESDCIKWLDEEQILPLLDGLDELGLSTQQQCIKAIDSFIKDQGYPYTVICCRQEEYETGTVKFKKLLHALILQPLSDDIIQNYLVELQRFQFWDLVEGNSDLHKLVSHPLYLSLLATVDNEDKQPISNSEELFNAFIDNQLTQCSREESPSDIKSPSRQECLHYLSWLAERMETFGEAEFLIEELQPSWLSPENQDVHFKRSHDILFYIHALPAAFTFIAWCLYISPLIDLAFVEVIGTPTNTARICCYIFSVLAAFGSIKINQATYTNLLNSNNPHIKLYERRFFYPQRAAIAIFKFDLTTLIYTAYCAAVFFALEYLLKPLFSVQNPISHIIHTPPIISASIIASVCALLLVIILRFARMYRLGIDYQRVEEKVVPNQGIDNTLRNCLSSMLFPGLLSGVLVTLAIGSVDSRYGLFFGIITGYCVAAKFGLGNGLETIIQHYVLRHLLQQERSFSRNCVNFLEYAQKLRFIQKVGGRYRFLHNLLRKHFATGKLPDYSEQ